MWERSNKALELTAPRGPVVAELAAGPSAPSRTGAADQRQRYVQIRNDDLGMTHGQYCQDA